MSVAVSQQRSAAATRPRRRVRQEARDALAVVAFSAVASTALALGITLLARIG